MEHFKAIHKLVSAHDIDYNVVGNCTFESIISYESKFKNIRISSTVSIVRNGYEEGKISLKEVGSLKVDDYHLDFTPDFQSYNYDEKTKSLIIEGKSSKMNGNYRVLITPIP